MSIALNFLRLVLPEKGLWIGLAKKPNELPRQRVFNNLEALLEWLGEFNHYGWNVYHALGGFDHPRGQINPETGKREKPRGADNALFYRSLWVDGDSQLSHPTAYYETQMAVWEATCAFTCAAKLPPPLPVNSGGGIHSYWPMQEDMDRELWLRLAKGLKRACIRHKFLVDHKVTANGAQVLRTPGFLHPRLQRQVQVNPELIKPYPVAAFMHLLEGEENYGSGTAGKPNTPTDVRSASIARRLAADNRASSSDPNLIIRNCPQIASIIRSPGSVGNTMHWHTGAVFKACGSLGIECYVGAVDDEYKELARSNCERASGYPLCRSFDEINPGGCAGCVFFDETQEGDKRFEISSPIHAGRIIVEAPQVNGHHAIQTVAPQLSAQLERIALPHPYVWWKDHLAYWPKAVHDKDAEPDIISYAPVYLHSVHVSEAGEAGGTVYSFRHWLEHEGWKTVNVAASDMHTQHGVGMLSAGGANVHAFDDFRVYVKRAVDMLNAKQARDSRYEQLGWKTKDGKRVGFLLGSTMLERGGMREVVVSEEIARRSAYLGPVAGGSISGWRQAVMELVPPEDWAGWFTVLCALGSVFMCWLHPTESGGLVNNRNLGSGGGKSTRLRAAASLFGTWDGLVVTNYDTTPSAGYIRSVLCHLPLIQDELGVQMKQKDPHILGFLVNMQCEGIDKRRMEAGGKKIQAQMGRFSNIMLGASNEDVHEHFRIHSRGTDALIQRTLQNSFKVDSRLSSAAADALEIALFRNGGHVGVAFLMWLLESDANMGFAEERLAYWTAYQYRYTNFEQKNRFYVRMIAAAATAGEILEKMGGILPTKTNYVIERVLDEQKALTGSPRPDETARATDGEAAMGEFFLEHASNVLSVPGPFIPGVAKFHPPPQCMPRGKLVIRHEQVNDRTFFPVAAFREFCARNDYSFSDCMQALERARFVLHRDKLVTLTAGTTLPSGGRVRCIELDGQHPMAKNLPSLVAQS